MTKRIYVALSFYPGGKQYTYHYDGPDEIKEGDLVDVLSSDGVTSLKVLSATDIKPPFATKPIDGLSKPMEGGDA